VNNRNAFRFSRTCSPDLCCSSMLIIAANSSTRPPELCWRTSMDSPPAHLWDADQMSFCHR
jgi:hypothetical protein